MRSYPPAALVTGTHKQTNKKKSVITLPSAGKELVADPNASRANMRTQTETDSHRSPRAKTEGENKHQDRREKGRVRGNARQETKAV